MSGFSGSPSGDFGARGNHVGFHALGLVYPADAHSEAFHDLSNLLGSEGYQLASWAGLGELVLAPDLREGAARVRVDDRLDDLDAAAGAAVGILFVYLLGPLYTRAIAHDAVLYRQRHKIENMFARLKDWRRVATRYDRCAHTFFSSPLERPLIAAVLLYAFGSGPVRGFAVTLGIGIIASMFTAIFALALHVADDSFLQPEPGTSAGDHLAGGLVPVALLAAAGYFLGLRRLTGKALLPVLLGLILLLFGSGLVLWDVYFEDYTTIDQKRLAAKASAQ